MNFFPSSFYVRRKGKRGKFFSLAVYHLCFCLGVALLFVLCLWRECLEGVEGGEVFGWVELNLGWVRACFLNFFWVWRRFERVWEVLICVDVNLLTFWSRFLGCLRALCGSF